LEDLVEKSYNTFNPDISITACIGKSFSISQLNIKQIKELKQVTSVQEVVSDLTLLTYNEKQALVYLKGVQADYLKMRKFQNLMLQGKASVEESQIPVSVSLIGIGLASLLDVNLNSYQSMELYYPNRKKKNLNNPQDAFLQDVLLPVGIFQTYAPQFDENYILTDINFVRKLMSYDSLVTAVEVFISPDYSLEKCRKEISKIVGDSFTVKDRYQMEEVFLKTIKSEKMMIFLILSFVLLIAAFNITACLIMLIIEKKRDIHTLQTMGASISQIGKIFTIEGIFLSLSGGFIGSILAAIVCFLQQQFHFISMGNGGHYQINYYPVSMELIDFLLVLLTIFAISLISSRAATVLLKKKR